jgi:hypothetical protein
MPGRTEINDEAQSEEFFFLRRQYEEAVFFVARRTFASLDGVLAETTER